MISGRLQDVRLGRPWDGQIGSLGDVLGTLKGDVLGTSWGPIFAGWEANKRYKMNEIVNKFLLAGEKVMPEMHLRQPGFTYIACQKFIQMIWG